MNKVIAIISDDHVLDGLVREHTRSRKLQETRKKFIEKQIDDYNDVCRKSERALAKSMMDRLNELGKLPKDFDNERDRIHFDTEDNSVTWHRCDGSCHKRDFLDVLHTIFGGPPKGDEPPRGGD